MTKGLIALIEKEFRLEARRKSSFAGIFLYLLSATFVTYLAFGNIIEIRVWIALFWIITLFSVINAGARSFSSESPGRMLYYHALASPVMLISAKLFYNLIMAFVTSLSGLLVFVLFFGTLEIPLKLFATGLLAGTAGFSAVVTVMSSLAAPSGGSATLVSVLSFPLMLPILISAIRASNLCISQGFSMNLILYWIVLLLIAVMVWVLAVILYPYIWKE